MNWKCKALLHLTFSNIPFGERLAYLSQRYVTKSLPVSDDKFVSVVSIAKQHLDAFQKYGHRPLDEARFYEFGAGWDMMGPLAFYAFGVKRQILVDLRHLLKCNLVNDTIEKFQRVKLELALLKTPDRQLFNVSPMGVSLSLKQYYGIDYRAPCDAGNTRLPSGSLDCISSTNTLEHIPKEDIRLIFTECHRLLRPDGLMTFLIDYQDHYSYFDKGISVYNFLQYSDKAWAFFNPALHYQNRLRHRDYLDLLNEGGFDLVEEKRKEGTETDLKNLEKLHPEKGFKKYSLTELAVRNAHIVVRKKDNVFR